MAYSARIDELEKKFSENARRYFAPLANEYRKAGDLDRAIEICRAHLPQQPGHMSGHVVYGQALYESRQLDEAKTVFEAALGLDPENLIALRHLGDIARDSSDPATARTWYLRVLDADPRNDEVSGMLAELDAQAAALPAAPAAVEGASGWAAINPELNADSPAADAAPATSATAAAEPPAPPEALDLSELGLEPMPSDGAAEEAVSPQEGQLERGVRRDIPKAAPPERPAPPSLDRMLDDAFASDADTQEIEPEAVPPSRKASRTAASDRDAPALDEKALAEVDALFDELSPSAPSGNAAAAPDSERLTGDAMFGDHDIPESRESDVAGSEPILGLETREFIPPPRPASPGTSARNTGSMAVSGLTSFEQPTDEDSSTRAAFVTETMAELYLQQGFTTEALEIYRQLLEQNPSDSNLRDRIQQLESGGSASLSVAAVSSKVIAAAQQRHAARPVRTVRSFFGRLAGHSVSQREEVEGAEKEGNDLDAFFPTSPEPTAAANESEYAPNAPRISLISDLFGEVAVSDADEEAAAMLSSAYAPSYMAPEHARASAPAGRSAAASVATPSGPTGRAAHTAGRELSLDQVFRESDDRSARKSGAFSFDQFFSDGTQAAGDSRAPADEDSGTTPPEAPEGDLEQFTAWLEGLKRK